MIPAASHKRSLEVPTKKHDPAPVYPTKASGHDGPPPPYEHVAHPTVPVMPIIHRQWINPDPVTQFNTLYLQLYYHPSEAAGTALLNFINNDANMAVLADNAAYQIPPYVGAQFLPTLNGARITLANWISAGCPKTDWTWTAMWEWVNTMHYWCPNPVVMLSMWNNYFTGPRPELQPYLPKFFNNPYNLAILQADAQRAPEKIVPYPNAQFSIDWQTARDFAHNWLAANADANYCYDAGPACEAVVDGFSYLMRWCPLTVRDPLFKDESLSLNMWHAPARRSRSLADSRSA